MRKLLTLLIGLSSTAAPALAHEEFRVVGEITQAKADSIQVKMRDGRTANVNLDAQTKISKDKDKADASALKAGQFVVVDAYGDDFNDLLALDIKLVPPIAPAK